MSKLKAFVRYDGNGRIIPGGPILNRFKPKVGNWTEINSNICCQPAIKCAPFYINRLESNTNPDLWMPGSSVTDANCNTIATYRVGPWTEISPGEYIAKLAVIKYDKAGNTLWQKVIEFGPIATLAYNLFVASIEVDSNNDIYLCTNIGLCKLTGNDGSILWMQYLSYPNPPASLVNIQYNVSLHVTSKDELFFAFSYETDDTYVTPCFGTFQKSKATITKLNPATGTGIAEKTVEFGNTIEGTLVQQATRTFTPINSDSDGNVYISFYIETCDTRDPITNKITRFNNTIKFDSNLNYLSNFQFTIDPALNVFGYDISSTSTINFYNLDIDKNNNFYFNAYGNTSKSFTSTIYTHRIKLDSNYNLQWCKGIEYTGVESSLDFAFTTVDSDGNTYILAVHYSDKAYLLKFDTNGNYLWATSIEDSDLVNLYGELWFWNANQMVITNDVLTMTLGTPDSLTPDARALFIKYPKDSQLLGTYGTTTFTDATSEFTITTLNPVIISISPIVSITNLYNTNLQPITYSIVPATNYTVSTTPI